MIVTGLTEVSKSRSKVYIDNEFAFVLYKGELRLYRIAVGEELSESVYEQIVGEVLSKRAKLRAMNLLTKRDYTTAKLREKLVQGGYPMQVVEDALAYVASYHYTDDLRYAVSFIEAHEESKSKKRMEQDLQGKGIPKDVIEKAFQTWEEKGGEQDEMGMIQSLLRKRGYSGESADSKEKQKQFGFLMRKGFSQENIRRALRGNGFLEDE